MNFTFQRKKSFQANDLIHDQFLVLGKIDNRKHSSTILKGFDKISRNFVVIKITSAAYREKNKNVTKILQKLRGSTGVPNIIWRGMEGPNTITVTECLGPNLKKLFLLMDKQFSVATIATIGIQVLHTLESIHSRDYVCCNIMPKEILISLHKKSLNLFITDYKQARKVKSGKFATNDQVSHMANKAILNKFSSVNLHLGLPASKKDDLESLGYILAYFFRKGVLFEKNVKISTKEEKIKFYEQQKLALIPETFCQGLPPEMGAYMTYIKSMQTNQLTEKIDYDYLKKLFRGLFNKHSSQETFVYDWISKARTYNLDPNAKQDDNNVKGLSEMYFKSEIVTFQSSRNQGSEVLSDSEDPPEEAVSVSPYVMKVQVSQSDCDFNNIEEFKLSSMSSLVSVNKVQVFQDKVETMSHVKRTSMSSDTNNFKFSKKPTDTEGRDEDGNSTFEKNATELSFPYSDELQRQKMKSVTEVRKMSLFGKGYVNNKVSKSN